MSSLAPIQWNRPEASVTIDLGLCCATSVSLGGPPIDGYYESTEDLVARAIRPEAAADSTLMGLLLLQLVSATEAYFRKILASTVNVCPTSRLASSRVMAPLTSADYYSSEWFALGAFEHIAFSSSKALVTQTLNLTGFVVKPGSSVAAALAEFDKVCQLRHAIIHSHGLVSHLNAHEMGRPSAKLSTVTLSTGSLLGITAITHNLVRAYNSWLAGEIVTRWQDDGLLKGAWSADKPTFTRLYQVFASQRDAVSGSSAWDFYKQVKKSFVVGGGKKKIPAKAKSSK